MSSECLSKLRRGVYDTAQGQQWTSEGVLYQAIDALGHLYACIQVQSQSGTKSTRSTVWAARLWTKTVCSVSSNRKCSCPWPRWHKFPWGCHWLPSIPQVLGAAICFEALCIVQLTNRIDVPKLLQPDCKFVLQSALGQTVLARLICVANAASTPHHLFYALVHSSQI